MERTEQLVTTIRVSQTSRIILNILKKLGGFDTLDETILYLSTFYSVNAPKASEINTSDLGLYHRLKKSKMKSKSKKVINKWIADSMNDGVSWVPSKSGKGKGKFISEVKPKACSREEGGSLELDIYPLSKFEAEQAIRNVADDVFRNFNA